MSPSSLSGSRPLSLSGLWILARSRLSSIFFGVLAACAPAADPEPDPEPAPASSSTQEEETCTTVGLGGGPAVGETHPGYRQPLCHDCHNEKLEKTHLDPFVGPADCAGCHGDNGAPQPTHATLDNPALCTDCHSAVSHVAEFTAPRDCVVCHDTCR